MNNKQKKENIKRRYTCYKGNGMDEILRNIYIYIRNYPFKSRKNNNSSMLLRVYKGIQRNEKWMEKKKLNIYQPLVCIFERK